MEEVTIPEYIDSPPQILFLELDDLMPMFFSLFLGTTADLVLGSNNLVFISAIAGAVLVKIYINFKRNQLPGTMKAFLYFHTGLFPINKKWTTGFLRRTDE